MLSVTVSMEAMLQPESETVWFVLEDLDKTVAGYWFFYSNFCNANKPFKTHVHKGETSVPSVLPRAYDAKNTLINVFRMFCERFQNVL
jgi:hypothetical protein